MEFSILILVCNFHFFPAFYVLFIVLQVSLLHALLFPLALLAWTSYILFNGLTVVSFIAYLMNSFLLFVVIREWSENPRWKLTIFRRFLLIQYCEIILLRIDLNGDNILILTFFNFITIWGFQLQIFFLLNFTIFLFTLDPKLLFNWFNLLRGLINSLFLLGIYLYWRCWYWRNWNCLIIAQLTFFCTFYWCCWGCIYWCCRGTCTVTYCGCMSRWLGSDCSFWSGGRNSGSLRDSIGSWLWFLICLIRFAEAFERKTTEDE